MRSANFYYNPRFNRAEGMRSIAVIVCALSAQRLPLGLRSAGGRFSRVSGQHRLSACVGERRFSQVARGVDVAELRRLEQRLKIEATSVPRRDREP
jgi:hypothetical protein